MARSPSLLFIDPHPIVRRGLAAVIADAFPDPKTTGTGDFADAFQHLRQHPVELVISDFRCGGGSLPELIERAAAADLSARFLAYSGLDEVQCGVPAVRAGASGFLPRSAPIEDLLAAVRTLLAGRTWLSGRLSQALANGSTADTAPVQQLTRREIQIYTHIGHGRTVSQIAASLGVSVKTIEAHREHIKNKLGLHNAAQVTAAASRWTDDNGISL